MIEKICAVTLAALTVVAPQARAIAGFGQPINESFVISRVRVFDRGQTSSDKNVVVVDGTIEAVVDDAGKWRRLPIVDGSGATLLPGLIDAHTHTMDPGELQEALRFGVTTVLDMFTAPSIEPALRRAARTRADIADFRSAGILATAPGGHGTEYGIPIPTIANAREADAFVAARQSDGADYLKIVLNGVRAAREGTPTLDRARTAALVRAAHARGMLAVAHVENLEDVDIAVSSGVDGLAHVWREGNASPALTATIARRKVFVVPTLATPEGFIKGSGATLANDGRLRPFLSDAVRARLLGSARGPVLDNIAPLLTAVTQLHSAGVTLLAGSDVPNAITVPGVSLHRELELLVNAGLSPRDALRSATDRPAVAFRLADRGRIARGYRADLVLVRGDPTTDISATRDILRIWRSGVEFDRRPAGAARNR